MTYDTLIFSDLHAHAWSEFASLVPYRGGTYNSRLVHCARVIRRAQKEVLKGDIKRVIFAGDLFHRKALIDVPVFNLIVKELWRLAAHAEVFLLAGNHDLARRSAQDNFSSEHALVSLSDHTNITVIDQPVVIDTVGFVPYASDLQTLQRGIDTCTQANGLILHAGILGAKTGPIEFQPFEPLTLDLIPNVPVFSGHYHYPQSLKGKCHVTYIGAPLEHMRGDGFHSERGMVVTKWANLRKWRRYAYTKAPVFMRADEHTDFDIKDIKGNYVDLVVRNTESADRCVTALKDCKAEGINVVFETAATEVQARLGTKTKGKRKVPGISDLCDAYIEKNSPKDSLDQTLLRQICQEVLQQVEARSEARK